MTSDSEHPAGERATTGGDGRVPASTGLDATAAGDFSNDDGGRPEGDRTIVVADATAGGGVASSVSGSTRYQTVAEIGRGGMGVVYRGRDALLSRDVAVKVMLDRHQ